jgi:HD-GYP domain-containing protein (c-di-GMP phosphodiesterase class II)
MPGYFVAEPPKIEVFDDKILKNAQAKKLIQDIPTLLSNDTKESAIKVLHRSLQQAKAGKMIDRAMVREVVTKLVEETILKHESSLLNLMDIRSHDKYTFSHSINVCTLATLIGIKQRLKRKELEDLALGALLHDIGKIMIRQEILEKPGRLTPNEFEEIKKHPIYSYNILSREEDISEVPRAVAYAHHERYDGRGYPRKLVGDEIPQLAVVTSLADVYDALTTDRPYRKSLLPYDAMRIIISQTYSDFDVDVVRAFLRAMSIYPLGSLVRLNTKEVGLIIKVNERAIVRPTIRILIDSNGELVPFSKVKDIDLTKDTSRFIIGPESEEVFVKKEKESEGKKK